MALMLPQVMKDQCPSRTPLEIPEILDHISTHLTIKDLASSVRVSRLWRDAFLPPLWGVIEVSSSSTSCVRVRQVEPDRGDLYNNRHLIHDLTMKGDNPAELVKHNYPNLRRLIIDGYPLYTPTDIYQLREPYLHLVTISLALVDVAFTFLDVSGATWLALSELHHLRNLSLCRVDLKADSILGFWRTCTKLERLQLRSVSIGESVPHNMTFDRLRHVKFWGFRETSESIPFDMLLRCPSLETISWVGWVFENGWLASSSITHLVRKGTWPRLYKLCFEDNATNSNLASILGGVGEYDGGLAHFELMDPVLDVQGFKALSRHFNTLVHLDLENVSLSPMIRDVLCCCPRLEFLSAGNLLARHVVDGGPWTCVLLRKLRISFRFEEAEQELQWLIFERLSTLTRLEQLTSTSSGFELDYRDYNVLKFRLDHGLAQIATLQRLIVLSMHRSHAGMEDIVWIAKHLKSLKLVDTGASNSDEFESAAAKDVLLSHGILNSGPNSFIQQL